MLVNRFFMPQIESILVQFIIILLLNDNAACETASNTDLVVDEKHSGGQMFSKN